MKKLYAMMITFGLIILSFSAINIYKVKADVPILSDFGYNATGSWSTNIENRIAGVWGEAVGGDGTAECIMAQFKAVDGYGDYVGDVTAGLYEFVDSSFVFAGSLLAQTEVKQVTVVEGSTEWIRFNFTGEKPLIVNNTRYYCVVSAEIADGNLKLMADSGAGFGLYEIVAFSDVLPDPLEGEIGSGYRRCIYCSYSVTFEDTSPVISDIPDQTILEGDGFALFDLDDYVEDVDNPDDELSWTYSGNVDLVVDIDADNVCSVSIPDVDWYGVESLLFNVTDPEGAGDEDVAVFTVLAGNEPPVITDIPDQTIIEGDSFALFDLDDYVEDADNPDDELSWVFSGNVDLVVDIDADHVCSVSIPDVDWYGVEMIVFNVTDPEGAGDEDDVTFSVIGVNDSPVISSPLPVDGAVGVSVSLSELSFYLSDVEGDLMDYSVETSPDIGDDFGFDVGDGLVVVDVGGLLYDTSYVWFVNVSDPAGSGDWVRETYSFTTESEPSDVYIYDFGYNESGISTTNIENRIAGVWGEAVDGDGTAECIMAQFKAVDGYGDYVGDVTAGLYEFVDSSFVFAGSLAAQTEVRQVTVVEGSTEWIRFNFTGEKLLIVNNTRYYCVVSAEIADGNLKLMADSGAGFGLYEIVAFSDVLPDPLEGEIGSGYRRCIYCSYSVTFEDTSPVISDIPDQTIMEGDSFALFDLDDYVEDADNPDDELSWTFSGNVDLVVDIDHVCTVSVPYSGWTGVESLLFNVTDPFGAGDEDVAVFTVIGVNDPPVISDPFPADGAVDVSVSLSELSFSIIDYQGDNMSYYVTAIPDIGNGSATDVVSGTYNVSVSGLINKTLYTWFVNVTDPSGSGNWANETFTFRTFENLAPIISNPSPYYGEIDVPLTPILEIQANDPEGDHMNIFFRTNASGTWETLGSNMSVINGTFYCNNTSLFNNYLQTYYWSINATDPAGSGNWINETYMFTTRPFDAIPPTITNIFAGNPNDYGGPYFLPETDIAVPDGYYTNDSHQQEDWIYINCTVTDSDSGVDEIWLHWLNESTWTNNSYQFIQTSGDFYEFNSSGIITDIASGYNYSFDIWINDTIGNNITYTWTKRDAYNTTGNRRYIQLAGTPVDIGYTPLYLYPADYTAGTMGSGYGPTPSPYNADVLHHDQGPDGTNHDTGYLLTRFPTDSIEEVWCAKYSGYWFDETITAQNDTLRNIYFHNWWTLNDPIFEFGYGKTRSGLYNVIDREQYYTANKSTAHSNISYNNRMYHLESTLMNISNPLPYTDNDIYEFFLIHYSPAYGLSPSIINNRSILSFVIFNVPDNATLQGLDTDFDNLNDYIELYVTYTSPFVNDTDDDGVSDYLENILGSDPNNYTDTAEIVLPILSMESPVSGSIDQPLNPTLSIHVTHPLNATMNITFRTNASGFWVDIGSNNSVHNGTYSQIPSIMNNHSITYYWSVNCSDGTDWTNETYHFTTVAAMNNAPLIYGENPMNGSMNVGVLPLLNVTVDDADNNTLTAYWYSNSSGGWTLFAINSSIDTSSGAVSIIQTNSNFSNYSIMYWWSVCVFDGTFWTNTTYSFITESEPVNIPPVAYNDSYNTSEDTTLLVGTPGVLGNDSDFDGPLNLIALLDDDVNHGNLTLHLNGSFLYTPDTNWNGDDSFNYHAYDGENSSNIATVTIIVESINDIPIANENIYSIEEDTTLVIGAPGVLGNDSDFDGPLDLVAVLDGDVNNGSLTLNSNGSFEYLPDLDWNGVDSFTYHAYDGEDDSNVAIVTITVDSVNDGPIVDDIPDQTILEGESFAVFDLDDYVEDADHPDSDLIWTYSGNVDLVVDIDVDHVCMVSIPDVDWYGVEMIVFNVTDPLGMGDEDNATFTITSVNDLPIATNDYYSTDEDTTLVVGAPGVLGNDSDFDGPLDLTALLDDDVDHGVLSLYANGSFDYIPDIDWNGVDSFTYHAFDGEDNSSVATVTITVDSVNDEPIVDDIPDQTILEGDSFALFDLDDYVEDADHLDSGLIWTVSGNVELTVDIDADNVCMVSIPDVDWYGVEMIVFNVTDPFGAGDEDVAVFTVIGVNDPPVISSPLPVDGAVDVSVSLSELSFYLSDVEGDLMDYSVETSPDIGDDVGFDVGDGLVVVDLSGLLYDTSYVWFVNVSDPAGSGVWVRETYMFTTQTENDPPIISNENPSNGSTGVPYNPTLSVDVEDFDEEILTIIFKSNVSGSWSVLGTYIGGNGKYSQTTSNMDIPNMKYFWSIHVSDGKIWTNSSYYFETTGSYIPTLKWSNSDSDGWTAVNPMIADIDADGRMEIIRSDELGITVFDGETGDIVWTKPMIMWNDHCPMEIIDLNKDGILEIIFQYENGTMAIHGNNASTYWYNPDAPLHNKYPVAGDIDADGYPEVFVTTSVGGSITAMTHDGQIYAQIYTYYPCFSGLSLGDTDQDGVFELYLNERSDSFGSGDGLGIRAFWASNLTERWNRPDILCSSNLPTLIDVDKDGKLDVVTLQQSGGGVIVLNSTDGSEIHYTKNIPGMRCHSQGTIYDIDNDGNLEIIASRESKPVIWDLYEWHAESADGLDYYGRLPYICKEPPAVADITGDGNVEILAYTYDNNITIFNNEYEEIGSFGTGGTHYGSAFIIAQDVDNDSLIELVYNRATSIYVYDTIAPAPEPLALTQYNFYSQHRERSPYHTIYGPLAPIIKNESPHNRAMNHTINPILSVYVYDYQQDLINITFKTNASGIWEDITSYSDVSEGTYTANTTDMNSIDTTYWWSVEVEDSNGNTRKEMYQFTTTITKPILTNPYPHNNGGTFIDIHPILSIDAVCYQGPMMDILFKTNATGTWEILESYIDVANGTFICLNTSDISDYDTTYWWGVHAKDRGSGNWTNMTFYYTTRPKPSEWWDHFWENRKEIIIDHTKVAGGLLNFPVLIRLDSDSDLALHAQSDGDDIVFVDYNGNRLSHEIELFDDGSGQLITWVNVTDLSSSIDTIFYLYYGNSICDNQENVESTWDADYYAVHHFNEISGEHLDSTMYHNDSTAVVVSSQGTSGGIAGGCDVLDGYDDFIQFPNKKFAAGKDEITVEVWINPDETDGSITIYDEWDDANYWQYTLSFDGFYTRDASGGPTESRDNDIGWSNPETDTWHHIVSWYSVPNGEKRIYLDGSVDTATSTNIGTLTDQRNENSPRLGYACDGDNFDGSFDEFRVSKIARSTEWLETTYNTIFSPDTFLFIDIEETHMPPDEPILSSENPMDDAIDITPNPTLSIYVRDFQGDTMNVLFMSNASGSWQQIGSTQIGSDGLYTQETMGMDSYDTTYFWSVHVTDPFGSARWTNRTFSFTTIVNNKPTITNPSPNNFEQEVPINPILSINVTDDENDVLNVLFMSNASGSWQQIGSTQIGSDGLYSQASMDMDIYNTMFWWSVNVTDPFGSGSWINETFCFTTIVEPGVWWNIDWTYRKPILINHIQVEGDLVNIPILVAFDSDEGLIMNAQPDGDDIVFTDYNGYKLHHEIELFNNTSGELVAWVNITSLTSVEDTILYIYYGNDLCGNQENVNGTWANHFRGVYHLAETSGNALDSSPKSYNAINTSVENQYIASKFGLGNCFEWDGSEDKVVIPLNVFTGDDGASGLAEFTLELWQYPHIVSNNPSYSLEVESSGHWELNHGSGYWRFRPADESENEVGGVDVDYSMSVDTWQYCSLKWKISENVSIYRNAVLSDSGNPPEGATHVQDSDSSTAPTVNAIGWNQDWGGWDGLIDEIRISDVSRSLEWITTSYNTMNSPETFIYVGSEET